jgi:two-component system CheB/CheR fusion protein
MPAMIFLKRASDLRYAMLNRYGALLLGGSGGEKEGPRRLPQPVRLFAGDRELEALKQPLERAARAGATVTGFEGRLARRDGSGVEVAMSATPLFDEAGKVRGAIATMLDISDRKEGDARRILLLHELQHRVKNILATIDALAARLLKSSPSIEEFTQAFRSRLQARGAMHVLLSERHWQGAHLRALAARVLAPYKGSVRFDGPGIVLQSSIAATLGMVLFELATNAVKYGALSTENGRVAVSWQVEGQGEPARQRLSLRWSERGGPPAAPPEKEGFGTSFVKRSIEYDLGGKVALDFSADGLNCLIAVPLPEGAATDRSRGTDDASGDG